MASRVGSVVARMWTFRSGPRVSSTPARCSAPSPAGGRSLTRFSSPSRPQQTIFASRRLQQFSAAPGDVRSIFSMIPRHKATAAALVSKLSGDLFSELQAAETLSTSKFTGRCYGTNVSVHCKEDERRTLPLELRSASKVPVGDTLLSFPGSLSAYEKGKQLFISDTNHHRIIIVDESGKILDYIGSSPGFEDGSFETARLYYPSSTVFDEDHDCLYIADRKNHVIRRAHMGKRTIDTVGKAVNNNESTMWSRFSKWVRTLGLATSKNDTEQPEEDSGGSKQSATLSNPCHLKPTSDGSLVVASYGFEALWALHPKSGQCSRIPCEGSEAVYEEFRRRLRAPKDTLEAFSLILPTTKQPEMISRVANIRSNIFFADTEGHMVRKMDLQTGSITTLQLSNFGCLGLPAWWSMHPLSLLNINRESGSISQSALQEEVISHCIQVQPGRSLLCFDPVLPVGMALAAPVENRSVWKQARGSVVELSTFGGKLLSHKVSGAQQWVDDFEELETDAENFDELEGPQQSEHGLPLYSFIEASLGSGEVLIDAVVYLKPVNSRSTHLGSDEGSREGRESDDGGPDTSSAESPNVQKDYSRDQEESFRVRNLHARVRIEVTNTAPSERTNVIIVQL